MTNTERKQAEQLEARFAALSMIAMYGGGARSKGHGFWMTATSPEKVAEFNEKGGYCNPGGVSITNNGKRSGNPHFWAYSDALALCEKIEAAA